MMDLLTAVGLMLVLEGALYALFPAGMKDMLLKMAAMQPMHLRAAGLVIALFGFTILGALRGF